MCSANSKCFCWHVLGNNRAGTGVCTLTNCYWSNQAGITANKSIITNDSAMLNLAIIIYGNSTTATVYILAYIRITDILQMWQFSTLAYIRILYLYEVTDMNIVADMCLWTEMYVRTEVNTIIYYALMSISKMSCYIVSDNCIAETAAWANLAVLTNNGLALFFSNKCCSCIF